MSPERRRPGDYRKPGRLLRVLRGGVFFWSIFGAVVVAVLLLMTQLR